MIIVKGNGEQMTSFNFGDNYRAAGINPGPEVLKLRLAPFEDMKSKIDVHMAINLTRLFFELPVPGGTDWFRNAFSEADPSFSLIDNAREASVLAGGLLEAAIEDGKVFAGLAVLTASFGGQRAPSVQVELVPHARASLLKLAVSRKSVVTLAPAGILNPAPTKLGAQFEVLAATPDLNQLIQLVPAVGAESSELVKTLASQVATVVRPAVAQIEQLKEEINMLWWHIGGWSNLIDSALKDFELPMAAALSAIDLADLCKASVGVAAAQPILSRSIADGRNALTQISILDLLSSAKDHDLRKLKINTKIKSVQDICPILASLDSFIDNADIPSWREDFEKRAGVSLETKLDALVFAMQVYRERLLLSLIP